LNLCSGKLLFYQNVSKIIFYKQCIKVHSSLNLKYIKFNQILLENGIWKMKIRTVVLFANSSAGPKRSRAAQLENRAHRTRAHTRARPAKARPSPLAHPPAHGSACACGSGPSQPGPGPPFLSPAWANCSPVKRGTMGAARSRSTATRRSRAIKNPLRRLSPKP
jgi:hypothetical protein